MTAERDLSRVWLDSGWWVQPNGTKRLLTWNAGTHELSLQPIGREEPIILAIIATEEEVRRRLDGWPDHAGTKDGLGWLAQRLDGVR
jgi:hypothetical protein